MDGRSIIRVIDGDREGESGGRMIPEESREHADNRTNDLGTGVAGNLVVVYTTINRRPKT